MIRRLTKFPHQYTYEYKLISIPLCVSLKYVRFLCTTASIKVKFLFITVQVVFRIQVFGVPY